MPMQKKTPKDAASCVREIAEAVAKDILHEMSGLLAARIEAQLRQEYAGTELGYIGRQSVEARAKMAQDVRRSFNGRNANEVARQLGIGRATVYRLLKLPG